MKLDLKGRLVVLRTGRTCFRFAKAEKQSEQADDRTAGGEEKPRVRMIMIRASYQ
ncbi:hypothetical protein GCM10023156_05480 [Novipirellula rosea]|uniref:Uncharacterized protein n=1 Tax=Novipirellula rosea TaxID=1031540 RepID=A0ABP8M6Z4_9BACT